MRTEPYEDKLSRLRQMAKDDSGTWDLSPKDQAAITLALDLIDSLSDSLATAGGLPAEMVIEIAAKAIEIVKR